MINNSSPEDGLPSPEQLTLEERVRRLSGRVATLESFVQPFSPEVNYSRVMIDIVPGGRLPERKTEGAIGFDVYSRAVLSPEKNDMNPDQPHLRRTLFDFENLPDDQSLRRWTNEDDLNPGKLKLSIPAGEQVLVGIGFITAMEYPMFFWLAPRSGLSSRDKITLTNTPGTVDPDYRGEAAAVLRNDSRKTWDLRHESRIAQMLFGHVFIPELELTPREEMPETLRGSGGFGSTGIYN